MATDLEARWMEGMAALTPRYIDSERVWCVAYDNEFSREIERFGSRGEAVAFIKGLKVSLEEQTPSPQSMAAVTSTHEQEGSDE